MANCNSAGSYYVVASVSGTSDFNAAQSDRVYFTVNRKQVAIPEAASVIYDDGNTVSEELQNFQNGIMSVVGVAQGVSYAIDGDGCTLSAINADSYYVNVSLTDRNNYEWTDGTNTVKGVIWTVSKKTVQIPHLPQNVSHEFDNTLKTYTVEDLMALCDKWLKEFGDHIIDTVPVVREAVESGKKILLEGQLGIMRDNDWGIYPYTTSSNPTVGGACNGSAIPAWAIQKVVGVAKAYSTSVGGGPYMTELFDETADKLREIGGEYGATTGRPRRCGWFDAVAADYACYMNGVTDVALTKMDVLDTFEKIKVCTGYMIDGEYYSYLPETLLQERAKPIYEEFDGWMEDTSKCRTWDELPEKAKAYVLALEKLMNTKITYISVGPKREQLIVR